MGVVTVDFVLQPTRYSGYSKVPPVLHSKGRRFSSVCPHAPPIFPFKTYSTHPRLLLKRTRRKEVWFGMAGLVSPRLEDVPHPPSTTNTHYHFFPCNDAQQPYPDGPLVALLCKIKGTCRPLSLIRYALRGCFGDWSIYPSSAVWMT
jgi:hypothetical protein